MACMASTAPRARRRAIAVDISWSTKRGLLGTSAATRRATKGSRPPLSSPWPHTRASSSASASFFSASTCAAVRPRTSTCSLKPSTVRRYWRHSGKERMQRSRWARSASSSVVQGPPAWPMARRRLATSREVLSRSPQMSRPSTHREWHAWSRWEMRRPRAKPESAKGACGRVNMSGCSTRSNPGCSMACARAPGLKGPPTIARFTETTSREMLPTMARSGTRSRRRVWELNMWKLSTCRQALWWRSQCTGVKTVSMVVARHRGNQSLLARVRPPW
mmetsp:Transcript_10034/g.34085  ORF Transcript_10034/g.34085 Transcript_10034/m.34085 type:complete len:276 (+) Transcript_10034:84-911(+)